MTGCGLGQTRVNDQMIGYGYEVGRMMRLLRMWVREPLWPISEVSLTVATVLRDAMNDSTRYEISNPYNLDL